MGHSDWTSNWTDVWCEDGGDNEVGEKGLFFL